MTDLQLPLIEERKECRYCGSTRLHYNEFKRRHECQDCYARWPEGTDLKPILKEPKRYTGPRSGPISIRRRGLNEEGRIRVRHPNLGPFG